MKSLKDLSGDALEQLIDYRVVDQNGDAVGSLHSLWSHPGTGAAEFLGVKTGWLFGHNHVVPAGKAELDEADDVVRLPYTELFIKEAPSIAADAEISEEEERRIYHYYGMDEGKAGDVPPAAIVATATPAPTSRWRRTATAAATHSPIDDARSGGEIRSGGAVRAALDDLAPSDPSGARTPTTVAEVGSYGTTNLYGSTGTEVPVSGDSLGEDMAREDAAHARQASADPAKGKRAEYPVEPSKTSEAVEKG